MQVRAKWYLYWQMWHSPESSVSDAAETFSFAGLNSYGEKEKGRYHKFQFGTMCFIPNVYVFFIRDKQWK